MASITRDEIGWVEYDLNLFTAENWDEKEQESTWDPFYTCQPSLYVSLKDNRSLRFYLEAFTMTEEETNVIQPQLEHGTQQDFFIPLDEFRRECGLIPNRISELLDKLPNPYSLSFHSEVQEINWINT